ncbi:hypothetical protein ACYATM_02960 [Lactobacillaceae bacterium Scapto_B20]
MEVTPEELEQVKTQLNQAQQVSHFVIFETYDPETEQNVRMIIDYNGYKKMHESRNAQTPMKIIRDFVKITDNMAKWAIAEHAAASVTLNLNQGNMEELIEEMNHYINEVLIENKLEPNK